MCTVIGLAKNVTLWWEENGYKRMCLGRLCMYFLCWWWRSAREQFAVWCGLVFLWILIFEGRYWRASRRTVWLVATPFPTTVLPQLFPFAAHLLHVCARTLFCVYVCIPKSQTPVTAHAAAPTPGSKAATAMVQCHWLHQWYSTIGYTSDCLGTFLGVRKSERVANHLPSSSAEIKSACCRTSATQCVFIYWYLLSTVRSCCFVFIQ